ncbi:hypothetical protein CEXT_241241 [Caerostris extrusa]|uniref:Uncharacterized protein n=1 Tax=Caerostris extrusa TaxID=172846 RepID=A0AAV4WKE0_CAEEX|nr:hypothetical protein CEXT_241241 [Caerostris extrusa]
MTTQPKWKNGKDIPLYVGTVAASSLPGSRQTTIAHPGRSRRAANLSGGSVKKKNRLQISRGAGELKGKERQNRTPTSDMVALAPLMVPCIPNNKWRDLRRWGGGR